MLGFALDLARLSGGAFDPTIGRVTRLVRAGGWGKAGPEPSAMENAWELTGWQHVELEQAAGTVFIRRRGLQLDLGGAAKGYIADEALESLRRSGISRALVSMAGDIVAGEPPPGEDGWRVAIDHGGPGLDLLLSNEAVSTSGGRSRYYLAGGRRCSHILAGGGADCVDADAAVSVVAGSGLEADALATALVALGRDRSAALLARYPQARAYWAPDATRTSGRGDQGVPSTASQR